MMPARHTEESLLQGILSLKTELKKVDPNGPRAAEIRKWLPTWENKYWDFLSENGKDFNSHRGEHITNPGALAARLAKNSPPAPEPEKPLTKKDVEQTVTSSINRTAFWTIIFMSIFKLFGHHHDD